MKPKLGIGVMLAAHVLPVGITRSVGRCSVSRNRAGETLKNYGIGSGEE